MMTTYRFTVTKKNMNRLLARMLTISFVAALSVFILFPETVSAAGLVPCGGPDDPCTLCHFITGISGIILIIRNIMFFVGLAVITAMGVLYILSGGDPKMMETAKGGIKATLIGIVVILFAWFIVNMVMFYIFRAKENLGVGASFRGVDGFQFECSTFSTSGSVSLGAGGVGSTSGGTSLPCEDIEAAKARIASGGTVCNNTGNAKRCNANTLNSYASYINAASAKHHVPVALIQAIMAQETGCNPNAEGPTHDCGIMQVHPDMQVSSTIKTPSCEKLKVPATGIDWGTYILAQSYNKANSMVSSYGGTVTVNELAAAIYNGGSGQSEPSADCSVSSGWKKIPKWGCPINPGSKEYNACDIRSYACNVGSY